jgi:hypothetical protein
LFFFTQSIFVIVGAIGTAALAAYDTTWIGTIDNKLMAGIVGLFARGCLWCSAGNNAIS